MKGIGGLDGNQFDPLLGRTYNELGAEARQYYETLVRALRADTEHVQHVHDVWGDPLTAAGVQSRDGKAAYVQINLAGDQGSTEGIASIESVPAIRRSRARSWTRSGAVATGMGAPFR